ncbi:MAG: hypothetical protein SOZ52_01950 [Pyramidobacter sp.]|nr:hypothetical protein [Pyramidobacter sp.]
MDKTVKARWEWRSFSVASLDLVISKLKRIPLGNHKESRDLYVVAPRGDVNVKIRDDGVLDVKVMQDSRPGGAELWQPAYRCCAPFDAPRIARIASFWGVLPPRLECARYSAQDFVHKLIPQWHGMTCADVVKVREIYALEDVIMEVGTVSVRGAQYRTFCVESEHFDSVCRVVRGFGLESDAPANYIQFLQSIL